jgi:DNA-binding PadR family transcriptional regulator
VTVRERTDKDGKPTGIYDIGNESIAPEQCTLGAGVLDAFYRYHDALQSLLALTTKTDLDGNYTRLAEKALRVAMLLASLENNGQIELRHWARAQQIAEDWRRSLHHLVDQLDEGEPSAERTIEDKIIELFEQHNELTARMVAKNIRDLASGEAAQYLDRLERAGVVAVRNSSKTKWYRLTDRNRRRARVVAQYCRLAHDQTRRRCRN